MEFQVFLTAYGLCFSTLAPPPGCLQNIGNFAADVAFHVAYMKLKY